MFTLIAKLLAWLLDKITGSAQNRAKEEGRTAQRLDTAQATIEAAQEAKNDAQRIAVKPVDDQLAINDELYRRRHPEAYDK